MTSNNAFWIRSLVLVFCSTQAHLHGDLVNGLWPSKYEAPGRPSTQLDSNHFGTLESNLYTLHPHSQTKTENNFDLIFSQIF